MNNTLKYNWTRWDHSNGWEHTQLKIELHFPIEFLLFHCYLMLCLMLLDAILDATWCYTWCYLMLYLMLLVMLLDAILDATWCVISNGSAQLSYRVLEGNNNILQQCWVPIFYFNMWTDERWPELFVLIAPSKTLQNTSISWTMLKQRQLFNATFVWFILQDGLKFQILLFRGW